MKLTENAFNVFLSLVLGVSLVAMVVTTKNFISNEPSSHNQTAGELRKAREAIWKGMSSLEDLEKKLETKAADYSEIKERLKVLEQTEKLSNEQLKSVLDAINYTQPWFDWKNGIIGFLLGVLSSLTASWLIGFNSKRRLKSASK